MATKNAALRNKMSEDFGVLFNGGKLIIRDSSTVLIEFTLGTPAFGSATAGTIGLNGLPMSEDGIGAGTADNAILESSDSTYQLTGLTVGTSGTNVVISNTAISIGQTINLITLNWTEAETIA